MPASGGKRPFALTTSSESNLLTSDASEWGQLIVYAAEWPELALGGVTCDWLYEALLECQRLERLPAPALPALIFRGSDESVVSASAIRKRAKKWPTAHLIKLKGAKHEPMIESPAIRQKFLTATIEHFLSAA